MRNRFFATVLFSLSCMCFGYSIGEQKANSNLVAEIELEKKVLHETREEVTKIIRKNAEQEPTLIISQR